MEAEAIDPTSALDFYVADLCRLFDAVGHPCENDRNRLATSTSTSPQSACGTFLPCPNQSPPSPFLMQAYANRPLPRLPPSASASPEPTAAMEFETDKRMAKLFTKRGGQLEFQTSAFGNDPVSPRQQYQDDHYRDTDSSTATRSITSQTQRNDYNPLARSSRRSSHKIHQLTGLQVDIMDNQMISPTGLGPDSCCSRSETNTDDYGVPDYHLVPMLEADDGKTSSRESSWGPMSPEVDAIPAPLNIRKPNVVDVHGEMLDHLLETSLRLHPDEDAVLSCESPHGQFSDVGAAGEYHRFAANLATRDSCHSRQLVGHGVVPSTTPATKKKRLSLGLAFSPATLFSRRREQANSFHALSSSTEREHAHQQRSPKAQRQSATGFVAGPNYSTLSASAAPILVVPETAPPRPPPAPPLMSAWDSDSDSDEAPAIPSLKDWFARRAMEDSKGHRRSSNVSRIHSDAKRSVSRLGVGRELSTRWQETEKKMKMGREKTKKQKEARPESVKKSFSIIPEDFALSPSRFL